MEEISEELPKVIKTIHDVKGNAIHSKYKHETVNWNLLGEFEAILANLKLAKEKINNGITDPNQIFVEKHEDVVNAWKAFEEKRKTMTYIPYIF